MVLYILWSVCLLMFPSVRAAEETLLIAASKNHRDYKDSTSKEQLKEIGSLWLIDLILPTEVGMKVPKICLL